MAEKDLDYNQVLTLMSIYRDEWMHRDSDMLSTLWRLVTISLVVTFLPNLIGRLGFSDSPLVAKLPIVFFSCAGIVCAGFGMFISIGESTRIEYLDKKYWDVMKRLPEGYQLESMKNDKRAKPFSMRLNTIFCVVPYSVVIFLAILNIIFHYFL